jgi:Holliday junction resolvasome RuvABC endonuclease subunit
MKYVTVDMSTKLLAYAMWDDDQLIEYGKIFPSGTADTALASFADATAEKFGEVYLDLVVYESAFLGKNVSVVKSLSKATGAMLGGFYMVGVDRFRAIPPITWQTGLGVGKMSQSDYEKLSAKHPTASRNWIKSKDRERRKQAIIDIVNKECGLDLQMKDNDIADAIGIGLFYWRTRPVVATRDSKVEPLDVRPALYDVLA